MVRWSARSCAFAKKTCIETNSNYDSQRQRSFLDASEAVLALGQGRGHDEKAKSKVVDD